MTSLKTSSRHQCFLQKGKVLFRHSLSFSPKYLAGKNANLWGSLFQETSWHRMISCRSIRISILLHGRSFVRKYIASQINNRHHVRVLVKGFAPRSLGMAGINYPQLGFTMNCRWSEEQGTKQCKLLKLLQFSRVSKHILRILDGLLRLRRFSVLRNRTSQSSIVLFHHAHPREITPRFVQLLPRSTSWLPLLTSVTRPS